MTVETVEIEDGDTLYRRLATLGHLHRDDGTVNSNAFKLQGKPDPEISVDLARLTTPEESLKRAPSSEFCLGALRAGDARSLGLTVRHKPTLENPAHSVIEGNTSKDTCRALAEKTTIICNPSPSRPQQTAR